MNPLMFPIIDKIIDTVGDLFPTEEKKNAAKLLLLKAEQEGALEEVKVSLSAILAEAQSSDPYTSRARPSFMYVVYIMLLFSLPMGLVSVFDASIPKQIAEGFGGWLNAIPDSLYMLFGTGYLGYSGFRSWDKKNGVIK
jgi:hypothetical protein